MSVRVRGWGQKAHPHSRALKLRAAITPYCKLSPQICWGESWRKQYVARWFSASQTSHRESNTKLCNKGLQALGVSPSGMQEIVEKSKLSICLLHGKNSRWRTASWRKPRTGAVRKETKLQMHPGEMSRETYIQTCQGLRDLFLNKRYYQNGTEIYFYRGKNMVNVEE